MRLLTCLLALVSLASTPAMALTLNDINEPELRHYAATLGRQAGNFQWQQLWQNSRRQGVFSPSGAQVRFTLPMQDIPSLVRETLSQPDQLDVRSRTTTYLRKDFAPRATGEVKGQPLTAICLWVDWRGAPERGVNGGQLRDEELLQVSLSKTEPC